MRLENITSFEPFCVCTTHFGDDCNWPKRMQTRTPELPTIWRICSAVIVLFFFLIKESFYSFLLKLCNVGNIISEADNEREKNCFQFQSRDL